MVLPVRLSRLPDWPEGPFPFELGDRRTDAETRSTYFAPASARALYGAPGRPLRWHLPLDVKHDGLKLLGLELLRAATAPNPEHALPVLHFTVERPLLPVLSRTPASHHPGTAHRAVRPRRTCRGQHGQPHTDRAPAQEGRPEEERTARRQNGVQEPRLVPLLPVPEREVPDPHAHLGGDLPLHSIDPVTAELAGHPQFAVDQRSRLPEHLDPVVVVPDLDRRRTARPEGLRQVLRRGRIGTPATTRRRRTRPAATARRAVPPGPAPQRA